LLLSFLFIKNVFNLCERIITFSAARVIRTKEWLAILFRDLTRLRSLSRLCSNQKGILHANPNRFSKSALPG